MASRSLVDRNRRLRTLRDEYMDSVHFLCPACGKRCRVTDTVFKGEDLKPSDVDIECADCGAEHIFRDGDRWFVGSDRAPYLPGSSTISTVLAHRLDRDSYTDKKEMYTDLIHMYEDSFCDARYLGEYDIMGEYARKCVDVCSEAMGEGHLEFIPDYLEATSVLIFEMVTDKSVEQIPEMVRIASEIAEEATPLQRLDFLTSCADLTELYPQMTDLILDAYTELADYDPAPLAEKNLLEPVGFYGAMAVLAENMGFTEDAKIFAESALRTALRATESPDFKEDDIEALAMCFQDNIRLYRDGKGMEYADRYVDFMSGHKEDHRSSYANALLNRFEFADNVMGVIRDDDAFDAIETKRDPKDDDERVMTVWAYLDLAEAYSAEDPDKAYDYYDCALDEASKGDFRKSERLFGIFRTLCLSCSAMLKESFKSRYSSFTARLKRMGVSPQELKYWESQDSEE